MRYPTTCFCSTSAWSWSLVPHTNRKQSINLAHTNNDTSTSQIFDPTTHSTADTAIWSTIRRNTCSITWEWNFIYTLSDRCVASYLSWIQRHGRDNDSGGWKYKQSSPSLFGFWFLHACIYSKKKIFQFTNGFVGLLICAVRERDANRAHYKKPLRLLTR